MMKRALKSLKLVDIRIDGDTQMRKSVSPEWIQEMVDKMKNGVEYPPVEARYDGTDYWLSDGFHRYHAHSQMGIKSIEVAYLPGTREDARRDAFKANGGHGLPLSREDKIFKVNKAIVDPLYKDFTDAAIADLCDVSKSMVGAVRRPEVRERQKENMKRHVEKKAKEAIEERSLTTTPERSLTTEVPVGGEEPDEAELLANEAQRAADYEAVAKLLDADDKLAHLYEEVQRLTSLNVGFELRIKELMNEKRSAVKLAEKLQKELDKIKGKK
jgi:hypothetical protein